MAGSIQIKELWQSQVCMFFPRSKINSSNFSRRFRKRRRRHIVRNFVHLIRVGERDQKENGRCKNIQAGLKSTEQTLQPDFDYAVLGHQMANFQCNLF